MSQSVTKLKQLLFDAETATLADLARRIDALAASGATATGELRTELEALARDLGQSSLDQRAALETRLDALRQSELEQREALLARIEHLAARVGDDQALARSVSAIIDQAIATAEEARHDDLSHAVAPVVIRTVRTEIRNSRDEIVEAIYPMTGQMVRAYVASAMKDLVAEINRRLEQNAFMLRMRALATGRSAAELAIADTQRLVVEELLLIRRGSGELVARWPERPNSNHDHVLGGVLTAINSFVSEALENDESALRQIDLGQSQLFLRTSAAYLLAARCSGTAAAPIEQIIDEEFLDTVAALSEHNGATDAAAPSEKLKSLGERLPARLVTRYEELNSSVGVSPLKLVGVLVGLPLAAWLAWSAYVRYETGRVTAIASEIIQTSPEIKGYPTRLAVSPRGRTVAVTGLAPNAEAQATLTRRLTAALPASAIDNQLAVLPSAPPDATPEIARLQQQLAALSADMPRQIALRAIERAADSLATAGGEFERLRLLTGSGTAEPSAEVIAATAESIAATNELLSSSRRLLEAGLPDPATSATLRTTLVDGSARLAATTERIATTSLAPALSTPPATRATSQTAATDADYSDMAEQMAAEAQRMAVLATALTQAAVTRAAIPPPPPPPVVVAPKEPTAREQLVAFSKDNAVFFGDETTLRDAARTREQLDRLAELLRRSEAFIRVVGYTDGRGSQSRNSSLSVQRATLVFNELRQRGVPADRMIVLGRESSIDISPDTGPTSANRRVEFEVGFQGEGGR